MAYLSCKWLLRWRFCLSWQTHFYRRRACGSEPSSRVRHHSIFRVHESVWERFSTIGLDRVYSLWRPAFLSQRSSYATKLNSGEHMRFPSFLVLIKYPLQRIWAWGGLDRSHYRFTFFSAHKCQMIRVIQSYSPDSPVPTPETAVLHDGVQKFHDYYAAGSAKVFIIRT